jgi:hypothetical protein
MYHTYHIIGQKSQTKVSGASAKCQTVSNLKIKMVTCKAIPVDEQSKLASVYIIINVLLLQLVIIPLCCLLEERMFTTKSLMDSMIFFKIEPCVNRASNIVYYRCCRWSYS